MVLLTLHKGGSTIMNKILVNLHAQIGVPNVNLAGAAWPTDMSPKDLIAQHAGLIESRGYYFGPLRTPHIGALGDFAGQRAVVHVRDPRDCIVSSYFSTAFSHAVPPVREQRERYLRRRQRTLEHNLDDFAVKIAPRFALAFDMLYAILSKHPDAWLSKYEDMVLRTEQWLQELSRFVEIPITPRRREALAPLLRFKVAREAPDQHIRQITPGDHLRKLKPETIEQVTETLRDQLAMFGYSARSEAD